MASSSDEFEDENYVILGTPVPELPEGQSRKKPTTIQDLTAQDKQGKRRFHGAFTGGFSAGYFNTVGTKEGFTPSTFTSSRSQRLKTSEARPEDFMDEEDFDEHGIAPRKFATAESYTSEERKRKFQEDAKRLVVSTSVNLTPAVSDLIIPEKLPIGMKLLRKMGWREGQGLGPRERRKKKKKVKTAGTSSSKSTNIKETGGNMTVKVYGCALPPSDQGESDSDTFVPENISDITFAPKDVCPIAVEAKDNVHGIGYRGIDPSLALTSSRFSLFDSQPVRSQKGGRGIRGQAFGVGAFEEEDEDIYGVDNMSNYNTTVQPDDDGDHKFGWTAPRNHGKQVVPVSYVGKMLEGFTLSSQTLKPKKKYPPPSLPPQFKPQHWFRKRRETSHLPADITQENGVAQTRSFTAVDRGLILGETPIHASVFDLIPKEDKTRIEATKQAVAITQSLTSKASTDLGRRLLASQDSLLETTAGSSLSNIKVQSGHADQSNAFLARFKPADVAAVKFTQEVDGQSEAPVQAGRTPMFQGSLNFQPFRKDPAKQARYDMYLTLLKQGATDPYSGVASDHMTEWEKSREMDEFSKSAKIFRPMSAMMSSRFVRGAMIDDDKTEVPLDAEYEKSDEVRAAEMKMFGKLTREECEWHPDKLLCRRFNVPNPYPGSDLVGVPGVKRDKYSVFNFLSIGDYQSGENQEPFTVKREGSEAAPREKSQKSSRQKKVTLASVFKVLDDPDFNKPSVQVTTQKVDENPGKGKHEKKDENEESDGSQTEPDKDLFRAIFKNSDSESSSDENAEENKDEASSEEARDKSENHKSETDTEEDSRTEEQSDVIMSDVTRNLGTDTRNEQEALDVKRLSAAAGGLTSKRSRWGQKSIFSVLDDLDKEDEVGSRQTSDVSSTLDSSVPRLPLPDSAKGHGDSDKEYGPRLPPTFSSTETTSAETMQGQRSDKSSNEHQQDRKSKKKKSKHKKDKKHKKHKKKSSKSRNSKREKQVSGSDADSEESDVSEHELLYRLKQASSSGLSLQTLRKL